MSNTHPNDPHAVAQPAGGDPPQHEPRVPGAQADEAEAKPDLPGKPFRTPSKNKSQPAPDCATDGDPRPAGSSPLPAKSGAPNQ